MSDDFNPTPIGEEYDEETGDIWHIYSPEDQAELDKRTAKRLMDAHVARMRNLSETWAGFVGRANATVAELQRTILEAKSNDRWHYADAEGGQLARDDEMTFRTVSLEAQKFAAQKVTSEMLWMSLPETQVREFKDIVHNETAYSLATTVYGYRHKAVQTSGHEDVTVTVCASWWQAFLAHVLKRQPKTRDIVRRVNWSVAAERFTVFPQLAFAVDRKWGARIELIEPRTRSWVNPQ